MKKRGGGRAEDRTEEGWTHGCKWKTGEDGRRWVHHQETRRFVCKTSTRVVPDDLNLMAIDQFMICMEIRIVCTYTI